jgi:hypothetical protein
MDQGLQEILFEYLDLPTRVEAQRVSCSWGNDLNRPQYWPLLLDAYQLYKILQRNATNVEFLVQVRQIVTICAF